MLETMAGLPPGVLGFEVDGALHADDYRDVLLPAVGAAIQRDEKVRIALVTDIDWMRQLTGLFGWMTPGELKHFPLAERDAAIAWAAAGD
jgi:hypothetical protein